MKENVNYAILQKMSSILLECQLYHDLRKSLIDTKYWKLPNMIKFIDLLKSENENTCHKLAIYIIIILI